MNEISEGYIYCFSNTELKYKKLGETHKTPEERLRQANSDTWTPPKWKIEIAKKVINPKEKEKQLHNLLSKYHERVHPRRELFRVDINDVKELFNLIDGELWNEEVKEQEEKEEEEEEEEEIEDQEEGCRDASKCFTNEQRIRHIITVPPPPSSSWAGGHLSSWNGKYNSSDKSIIQDNGTIHKGKSPLSRFAISHYKDIRPDRTSNCNAWKECECFVNDEWISTYNLKSII